MENIEFQDEIKQKIKEYQVPECNKGDFHESLNQVCIDKRCELKNQLQILCSGCLEDQLHSQLQDHQHRLLKKILWEIQQEINQQSNLTTSLEELETKLICVSKEFQQITEFCQDLQSKIADKIKLIQQVYLKENLVKEKLKSGIQDLLKTTQIEQIEKNLALLRENLKFNISDKLVVNNDNFDKEWKEQIFMVDRVTNSCNQLLFNLKNTGLLQFELDKPYSYQAIKSPSQMTDNVRQSIMNDTEKENQTQKKSLTISTGKLSQQLQPGFSPFLKSITIEIINDKIAKQTKAAGKENRLALIEPPLNMQKKVFQAFQIIKQSGWIGLGVAKKSVIQQNNYGFSFEDCMHGQFLVSNNGYKWIHNNQKENGQNVGFLFEQGSIVLCEFDPSYKRLRYKKKGSDKIAMMIIEIDDNDQDDFYMCVNLSEKDDSISIFSNDK